MFATDCSIFSVIDSSLVWSRFIPQLEQVQSAVVFSLEFTFGVH